LNSPYSPIHGEDGCEATGVLYQSYFAQNGVIMTNLGNENLCADSEQAKRRAKSIKTRMKELGYEMPLTHAYEALASSCGFRNWPTMKAQFDQPVYAKPTFLDELEIEFSGESNLISSLKQVKGGRLDLFYAPTGKGKTTLINALILENVRQALSKGRGLPEVRIIDVGPSTTGLVDALRELLPAKRKDEVAYFSVKRDGVITLNPFDLPLGLREPTARMRTSLVHLMMSMAFGWREISNSHDLKTFFGSLIDSVYNRLSDRGAGVPKLYGATNSSLVREINARLLKGPRRNEAVSWWNIVDELVEGGEFELAELAQRHAVPTMQDFHASIPEKSESSDVGGPDLSLVALDMGSQIAACSLLHAPTTLDTRRSRSASLISMIWFISSGTRALQGPPFLLQGLR
jgi:hypothetical protein